MDDDFTADFLAREQAILGADAALFGNPLSQTQQTVEQPTGLPATMGEFDDSLFVSAPPAALPNMSVCYLNTLDTVI